VVIVGGRSGFDFLLVVAVSACILCICLSVMVLFSRVSGSRMPQI
jgi:hypothetical protein